MKPAHLAGLKVGRLGLGAMGMSVAYAGAGSDDAESIRTIHRAIDLGVTLIDTAESTGPTSTKNSWPAPWRADEIRWCWQRSSA